MTIKEVVNQIYDLSVGGYFNGEKFTKERLNKYITNMLRTGNWLVINIAMPDGRWWMEVRRYANNEYDYYIPDTREQEKNVKALIGID